MNAAESREFGFLLRGLLKLEHDDKWQSSPLLGLLSSPFTADISPSFIQVYRYPRQLHTAISISINAVQYRQEENHSLEAVDLRGHPLHLLDLSAQQGQCSLHHEVDKMTHLRLIYRLGLPSTSNMTSSVSAEDLLTMRQRLSSQHYVNILHKFFFVVR